MPYDPTNNPYIPGDPYSYDLKWIIEEIKRKYKTVGPGEIIESMIADGAITEDKLADDLKKIVINDYITPQMYGAAGNGIIDDSAALETTISAAKTLKKPILIPKESTIRITRNMLLDGGLVMQIEGKVYADSCTAIKVLGLRNMISGYGSIEGSGSNIGVLYGGANKTNHANHNILAGIKISNFDIAVNYYNDQQNALTVYFNIAQDLQINDCEAGIRFDGNANAEMISNIIFTNCGSNNSSGGAMVFRNIDSQYPLDNSISQIFHHSSLNAITLNIEKIIYSQFIGIVCEQGGASAKSLVITDTTTSGNQFYLTSNVAAYRTIPADCLTNNIFSDISGDVSVNTLNVNGDVTLKKNIIKRGNTEIGQMQLIKRYNKSNIAENTDVELLQVNKVLHEYPSVFRIKCLIGTIVQATTLRKYAEAIIFYSGLPSSNVTVLQNFGNTTVVCTNDGLVTVNSGNNGTGTTAGVMLLEIEQIFYNRSSWDDLHYTVGDGFTEM